MADAADRVEGCRHNRAPLIRLGKIRHERTGQSVYVLLCSECGFTVTTDQLRRLRANKSETSLVRHPPRWAPASARHPIH
jgi:hypothetical protein